ncbi:MAG: hypothetical protein DLM55_11720 [Acidimicrobiales bacterium]|nr:MAG: hypothetical protein DLM55_11720 [Acidimicrobiales bacterium]
MHEQLTTWSIRNYGEARWYLNPGKILTLRHCMDIAVARQRATTGKSAKPETPGRVVAELSFGFWRYLVATQYDRTLWHGGLYTGPSPAIGKRSQVHSPLVRLHELRTALLITNPSTLSG